VESDAFTGGRQVMKQLWTRERGSFDDESRRIENADCEAAAVVARTEAPLRNVKPLGKRACARWEVS